MNYKTSLENADNFANTVINHSSNFSEWSSRTNTQISRIYIENTDNYSNIFYNIKFKIIIPTMMAS